jgi:hypothetical protein
MASRTDQDVRDLGGVEIRERTDEMIAQAVDRYDLDGARQDVYHAMIGLRDYAREHSLGVKPLSARMRGMSMSVISEMFGGTYRGNMLLRGRAIQKFLAGEAKRRIYGGVDQFIETDIARHIWMLCEQTRYNRRIQILQSPEQLGKTRALDEYTHRNNSGRTLMITLKQGCGSRPMTIFIRDLAIACGVESVQGNKLVNLRYHIREALAVCDLVILDEFHAIRSWPERDISDLLDFMRVELNADRKRGVLVCSTNDDVMGLLDWFRRRTRYNLGQLLGRMCNDIREIRADEIPIGDIEALVSRYYKPARRTIAALAEVVTREGSGHFGLLSDVMDRVWSDCQLRSVAVTDDLVMSELGKTLDNLKAQPKTLRD